MTIECFILLYGYCAQSSQRKLEFRNWLGKFEKEKEKTKMKEERTIIIKENENAEEVEAYEEKIIKLLAEILMEIQE